MPRRFGRTVTLVCLNYWTQLDDEAAVKLGWHSVHLIDGLILWPAQPIFSFLSPFLAPHFLLLPSPANPPSPPPFYYLVLCGPSITPTHHTDHWSASHLLDLLYQDHDKTQDEVLKHQASISQLKRSFMEAPPPSPPQPNQWEKRLTSSPATAMRAQQQPVVRLWRSGWAWSLHGGVCCVPVSESATHLFSLKLDFLQ